MITDLELLDTLRKLRPIKIKSECYTINDKTYIKDICVSIVDLNICYTVSSHKGHYTSFNLHAAVEYYNHLPEWKERLKLNT